MYNNNMKYLIIGLGNPENKYKSTRHNIGFQVINDISKKYLFPNFREKNNYYISNKVINYDEFFLLKPYSYMNNSGDVLPKIIKSLIPEEIVVIHDDIDLTIGDVRIKFAGGNAGHNGLKSIDAHIGKNYWRIRVGIGRPQNNNISIANFVLGEFSKEENEILYPIIDKIADNFFEILKNKHL